MRRSEIVAAARTLVHEARVGLAEILRLFRIRQHRRASTALLCLALGVVIGGTAALWVFPERAKALPSCFSVHYGRQATPVNNHAGVGVFHTGMEIFDIPPTCDHVSSVIDQQDSLTYTEIGWFDAPNGWTIDNSSNCTLTGTGHPVLFREWTEGALLWCTKFSRTLTGGTYHTMGISDQNGDGVWNTSFDGLGIGNPFSETFSIGALGIFSNGERYGSNESARATFNGLVYMPLGGGWTDWATIACASLPNNDPNYFNDIHSQIWVDVNGTNTCPQ